MDAGVDENAARMLAAQSALETAGWTAMWNYNFGNITTASSDYVLLPGNALHFKPYGSIAAGASDFVDYLTKRGLLPFAENGDLQGYVDRLQAIGYAGNADYGAYASGMRSWLHRLGGVVPAFPMSQAVLAGSILLLGTAVAWGIHEGGFEAAWRAIDRTTLKWTERLVDWL
jgi:hypothetical protein